MSDTVTLAGARLFLAARVVHAGAYVAGITGVRTLAWVAGVIGTATIFTQLHRPVQRKSFEAPLSPSVPSQRASSSA